MALLETKALTMKFGGLIAIDSVDITVESGEIRAIIGPNGAGKTTFFNMVSGLYTPTSGDIFLEGLNITNYRPYQITFEGIARTFQNILLFDSLSVIENVMVGRHCRMKYNLLGAIMRTKHMKASEVECWEHCKNLTDFVGLGNKLTAKAGTLSYGQKRLLEIARALASDPILLMLDEPAAGMNAVESMELIDLIYKIREMGITVLLVEHDMKVVMGIADKITVLHHGLKIAEGVPVEIKNNNDVIKAYLGTRRRRLY